MSETPKTFRKRSAIGVVFVARNTMFTSTRYMNTFALARMARSSVVVFDRLDNKKRGGNMPSENSNQPKLNHIFSCTRCLTEVIPPPPVSEAIVVECDLDAISEHQLEMTPRLEAVHECHL
jgi:hypothetical protein